MVPSLTLSFDETAIYCYLLLDNLGMINDITLIAIINAIITITNSIYSKDSIRIIKKDFLKSLYSLDTLANLKKPHFLLTSLLHPIKSY